MSMLKTVYGRSPIWLQHALASAEGLRFRARRASSRRIQGHLRFLLRSQRWSREEFHRYQIAELQALLEHAFANVPHYRALRKELGCRPQDVRSLDDFRRLPLLDKADLRGRETELVDSRVAPGRCWMGFTSGTTGTPLRLYETRESMSRRLAFVARLRSWAGLAAPIYPRRAQFTGRDIVPPRQKTGKHVYWRYNLPGNALLLSTSHISAGTVVHYVRALRCFRPDLIDGYPSAILTVARLSKERGLPLPRPKAIITSAETLLPAVRHEIETAFGCKVYDQYASSEPSCFWCNCEQGSLHVSPEYGISEILRPDGTPAAPGEEGEVVVTSFLNRVMPLIRYRLGDVAVPRGDAVCRCGRQMPCVERIVGRTDDILFVPERGYVGRLDPVFKGLSHIVEAQIVQQSLDMIHVLLVPGKGYDESAGESLARNLRAKLGSEVHLKIILVDRIPRGANGKFRSVVSKAKHSYPQAA